MTESGRIKPAYCSGCGNESHGQDFCSNCGLRLCRQCGIAGPDGTFCTHCGAPLHAVKGPPAKDDAAQEATPTTKPLGKPEKPSTERPETETARAETRRPRTIVLVSALVALALAVGAGAAIVVTAGAGGDAKQGSASPQQSAASDGTGSGATSSSTEVSSEACETKTFPSASGTRYIKIDVGGPASCSEAWQAAEEVLVRGDLDWRLQSDATYECSPPGPDANTIGSCEARDGTSRFTVTDITDITNGGYMD